MASLRILILLGIVTALAPFSGFPESWKALFIAASGLIVALIAISIEVGMYRRSHQVLPEEEHIAEADHAVQE